MRQSVIGADGIDVHEVVSHHRPGMLGPEAVEVLRRRVASLEKRYARAAAATDAVLKVPLLKQGNSSRPDAIIPGALHPPLQATPTEGGYRVSGRCPLVSGCHAAHWLIFRSN